MFGQAWLWYNLSGLCFAQPPLSEQYLRQPREGESDIFWGSIGYRWERYADLALDLPMDDYPNQSRLYTAGTQLDIGGRARLSDPFQHKNTLGFSGTARTQKGPVWAGLEGIVQVGFEGGDAGFSEAIVGSKVGSFDVWGGARPRWVGNGRYGNLLYSDSVVPVPTLGFSWEQPETKPWGRLYTEFGLGWLHMPRQDVNNPLLLLMDFRYKPVPWLELSASRLSILGGEGRPFPPFSQMLLPLDPHVENDPNQLLPDQDELASLEAYARFPLQFGFVTGIEVWWQYGAEDAIKKRIGVLPYISLAGVANLGGMSVHSGPWRFDFEAADIIDDRFRWYQGHRIYHDGFSVADQWLGYPTGGDVHVWTIGFAWLQSSTGTAFWLSSEKILGAIQSVNGTNYALIEPQLDKGISGEYWRIFGQNRLSLQASIGQTVNVDFIPEQTMFDNSIKIQLSRVWEQQ